MRAVPRSRRTVWVLLGVLVVLGVAGVGVAATPKPDFGVQVSPASQSVARGQTATYPVTTTGTGGFSGPVAYRVSGLPSGVTAGFAPSTTPISPRSPSATAMLSLAIARSAPAGTYGLTITGTSGNTRRSVSASLTVTYALDGSFTVTATPASVSVALGSTSVHTVTVAASGGFSGSVRLAPYGFWPAGVTPTFSPAVVSVASPVTSPTPSSATSSLQVATKAGATRDGTYTLYVVAASTNSTGRTTYQYAKVGIVIDSELSSKPFTISAGAPASGLAPGVAATPLDLTITNPRNKRLPVTNLSVVVTGTSAGAACGPDNFSVTQYSGPYPLYVPARATAVPLSMLGVAPNHLPRLAMVDKPTVNQDECKGVTVTLSFSGSARGN
jgi:hypothetical protein